MGGEEAVVCECRGGWRGEVVGVVRRGNWQGRGMVMTGTMGKIWSSFSDVGCLGWFTVIRYQVRVDRRRLKDTK